MTIKKIIKDNKLETLFVKGSFGMEKEGLRTTSDGKLALTPHPRQFGSRDHHPYIQTDFSESQIELVTPPQLTLNEQYNWLVGLHDVVNRSMEEDEFLWPLSMPNILPEEADIPIINVEDTTQIDYREELARKYGKKKQMISGIHFNFSFVSEFIEEISQLNSNDLSVNEWSNVLYLKMARNFIRYQWVLTYLFGASPSYHDTFIKDDSEQPFKRSVRNSPLGYHNEFNDRVSYATVEEYAKDIEALVEEEILVEEREYYGSARLRGKGKAVRQLIRNGTKYLELRSFDVNPYDPLGFSYKQSLLLHLFLLTMVWMDQDSTNKDIQNGLKKNEVTAEENPFEESAYKEEGLFILDQLKETCEDLNLGNEYKEAVDKAVKEFMQPELTLSAKVVRDMEKTGSFVELGRQLGQKYKQHSFEKPFLLRGFESMEMSSQLLLFDALQLGIETTILDKQDQFFEFNHNGKKEYVKNGNMTSKDTYISHWIMANKTVTKKIINQEGYIIPAGEEYINEVEAIKSYPLYKDKAIVVKPKSTNYGIGISIFKKSASKESFTEAIKLAFKEDTEVLVEEFVTGTEYRFFVIDGKVEAVLLREPANVVGDGEKTISELIEEKNKDLYRGEKHRAPLEKIKMGEVETLMLKEQGYAFDDTLEKDKKVFLRENSNISTGGDSVDITEDMHESYKQIAVDIAEVLEVNVTGLDLIVPDLTKPSTLEDPGYTVIEANFNPAMHMHAYVYKGEGKRLTKKVLDMLYPNVKLAYNKNKKKG